MSTGASGSEPLVVVSVDFGTTFSGYAFSFAGERDKVILNKNWASKEGAAFYKTPTCVLTNIDHHGRHTFRKFGFEAQEDYTNLVTKDKTLCLYDKFKMELHDESACGYHGPMLLCIIRDRTTSRGRTEIVCKLPISVTVDHLLKAVAYKLGYSADSFHLIYCKPENDDVLKVDASRHRDERLGDLCSAEDGQSHLFNVEPKDTRRPTYVEEPEKIKAQIADKRGVYGAPTKYIFQQALKYIMEHVLEHFDNAGRKNITQRLIRWVLTVPAIWSDQAKRFMREAALEAKLIDSVDSDNLRIALEPEAASLLCRHLDISKFEGEKGQGFIEMQQGAKYILLDAGGGTVDIAIHEVLEDGRVREVLEPTGGPWGGTVVNAAFWKLLAEVLGEKAYFLEKLKEEHPKLWWEIEAKFEQVKRVFDPSKADWPEIPIFSISMQLDRVYSKLMGGSLIDVINDREMEDVSVNDECSFILTTTAMKGLFDGPAKKIVKCIHTLFEMAELKNVKYLFMVGGFSHSPYLREVIKSQFDKRVKVLIPEDPALAVMKGAVMYCHKPDSILSRIARRTYGVATQTDFDPKKHKPSKKVIIGSRPKCKDIFSVFIHKGESIKIGNKIQRTFAPKTADATAISFDLLATDSKEVTYSDEPGVEKVGYIEIPMPDITRGKDRRAYVTMILGDTEIKVTAADSEARRGETKVLRINFNPQLQY